MANDPIIKTETKPGEPFKLANTLDHAPSNVSAGQILAGLEKQGIVRLDEAAKIVEIPKIPPPQ